MKRFLFPSLVILFSIFLGQLFGSSSVSAATVYDGKIQTMQNLKVWCRDRAPGLESVDLSTSWVQFIKERVEENANNGRIDGSNAYTKMLSKIEDGAKGGWMVFGSRYDTNNTPVDYIDTLVLSVFDEDVNIGLGRHYYGNSDVYRYAFDKNPHIQTLTIPLSYDYGSNGKFCEKKNILMTSTDYSSDNNFFRSQENYTQNWFMPTLFSPMIENALHTVTFFFIATENFKYPPGYQGSSVPEGYNPPEIINPALFGMVTDKSISVTHRPRADRLPSYPDDDYSIEYTLFKCSQVTKMSDINPEDTIMETGSFFLARSVETINMISEIWEGSKINEIPRASYDRVVACQKETDLAAYKVVDRGGSLEYTSDTDHSFYMLQANYLIKHCYRYPSYPATPDYCYYTAPEDTPKYDYTPTWLTLPINGGQTRFDTDNMDCVNGYDCQVKPIDPDYCKELKGPAQMNCYMSVYAERFNFGLINPSIIQVRRLIGSLEVTHTKCSVRLGEVNVASKRWDLEKVIPNICDTTDKIHSAVPAFQIMVNFIFGFMIFRLITRIINSLTDNSKSDLVQV